MKALYEDGDARAKDIDLIMTLQECS